MKKLIIQTFESEKIGIVIQDDYGRLEVHGETPEYEDALRQLIESISSNPIPYRIGEKRETSEGIEYITIIKMCHQGDAEFLDALKDILPKYALLGKRIRGILI